MTGTSSSDGLVLLDHSCHAAHHAECPKHLVSVCVHKNLTAGSVVISSKEKESRLREAVELPKVTQQTRCGARPQVPVLNLHTVLSGAILCFFIGAFGRTMIQRNKWRRNSRRRYRGGKNLLEHLK